jgi:predicted ATPase
MSISNIKYKDRVRLDTVEFKPGVNIIIGPNGSGKSTILEILSKHHSSANITTSGPIDFMSFDFEKDNIRTKSYIGDNAMAQLAAKFKSHGQVTRSLLKVLVDDESTGKVMILDEPEQALDIDGIILLNKYLKKTKASQIILSTHNFYLILNNPKFNIIELESGYTNKIKQFVNKLNK